MATGRTILFIGIDPQKVDFSAPGLPPGMNPEKIQAGIDLAMKQFADAGDHADACMFDPAQDYAAQIGALMDKTTYDCVVIGGGIRVPPSNLALFETVVNTVHRHGPSAVIAFNSQPDNSLEAVNRVLAG